MIQQPRSQWAVINQSNRDKQIRADKLSSVVWGIVGTAIWAELVLYALLTITGGF